MNTGFIILFSLISFLAGGLTGLLIYVPLYPNLEVRKILRKFLARGNTYGAWDHLMELADHNMKDIVKPNCETFYSVSFIRKADGPYILSMPAFDCYFSFAFLRMNTDVMGYITNRDANPASANDFIISYSKIENPGLRLSGIELDSDVTWIIGRFELTDAENLKRVNEIQGNIKLTPLRNYLHDD
ncbi:MAG: DUF1254 domain-containing protein [Bacteroidales bacterium]|nr:DUF1254 domain-containing protein [Bacteroidales bacterium]